MASETTTMADTQAQAATVPDPVPTSTYDDDDLIDYDDDALEPTKELDPTKTAEFGVPPKDAADIKAIAPDQPSPAPTFTDKDLSKAATTTAQERIVANEPTSEKDEIDYDDEEELLNGISGPVAAPVENEEATKADQQNGHDQEDEEIDFGINEDNVEIQPDVAATTDEQHSSVSSVKIEMDGNTAAQDELGEEEVGLGTGVDEGNARVTAETSESAQVSSDLAQSDQPLGQTEISQANLDENDEITWEDPEDETALETSHYAGQSTSGKLGAEERVAQPEVAQEFVTGEQVEAGDHTYDEADNVDEEEYPAITVQYKGEEFPLFSITSEGFFTSTSVLHDNIGNLLAGFREELANEIASEDELVFQIDELGLEYAESHSQDTLGHVTLNQILEIHDLLVKNQDPDSDRDLYTYLLTRPSTTKRFESLIESAAAGTGLDKVIFHFDSPVPQGTHPESDHLMAEFHDLDQYQSSDDANTGVDGQNDNGDEDYGYIEGLDDNTDVNANTSENAHVGQSGATEQEEPHTLAETQPEQIDEGDLAAGTVVDPEIDVAGNAFADADFEMVMEAGVDGDAETSDFDINGDLAEEYQNGGFDITNAESSASNTVANEGAEVGMTAEEAAEALDQYTEDKTPDQIEDEIDWRSEPGQEDTSTLSAGAAKRSHDTVGLNEGDGPEPKRQRS